MADYEMTIGKIRSQLREVASIARTYQSTCMRCGKTRVGGSEERDNSLLLIARIQEAVNLLEAEFDEIVEEAEERQYNSHEQ